ncbi:MAG: prepilin-type N-terminal cleavage/methylation domain-containing protein [Phycisphaerales bacterium]|nr:prepilin-type N-terminal cleavage/methylation domain-containing protein [Phycisphaerales bacterium]
MNIRSHSSFIPAKAGAICVRSRAFTLLELLVVVSIISVLVALLLPALGKAKQQAKSTACSTNIYNLCIGIRLYFTENNDSVPINGLLFPKSGVPQIYQAADADPQFAKAEDKEQQHWRLEYGALWKEMGGTDVPNVNIYDMPPPPIPKPDMNMAKKFLCPSDITDNLKRTNGNSGAGKAPLYYSSPQPDGSVQVLVSDGGAVQPGYWSYSVNAVLNSLGRLRDNPVFQKSGKTVLPWQDPVKLVSIHSPENFVVFLEEDQGSLFNDEVFEPPQLRDASTNSERLSNRHNGGGNIGFADGHAEWWHEIAFDNGSQQSTVSRMFFPDGGEFLGNP